MPPAVTRRPKPFSSASKNRASRRSGGQAKQRWSDRSASRQPRCELIGRGLSELSGTWFQWLDCGVSWRREYSSRNDFGNYDDANQWVVAARPRSPGVSRQDTYATENRSVGGSIPPLGTLRSGLKREAGSTILSDAGVSHRSASGWAPPARRAPFCGCGGIEEAKHSLARNFRRLLGP